MSTPGPGPRTMKEKAISSGPIERREICKYVLEYEWRCGGRLDWRVMNHSFEEQYPNMPCIVESRWNIIANTLDRA